MNTYFTWVDLYHIRKPELNVHQTIVQITQKCKFNECSQKVFDIPAHLDKYKKLFRNSKQPVRGTDLVGDGRGKIRLGLNYIKNIFSEVSNLIISEARYI